MNLLLHCKKSIFVIAAIILLLPITINTAHGQADIGVIFVIHGGNEVNKPQYMWDAAILQFSFDHNHSVNSFVSGMHQTGLWFWIPMLPISPSSI